MESMSTLVCEHAGERVVCPEKNKHFCKEVVASTVGFMPVSLSEIKARVMG